MEMPRLKFQNLLRELFQFDCVDLDFGIYRIMNQKRALIEQFIEKDLLDAVAKELKKGTLKEQGDLVEQLATLAAKIREDIGDDAIDADGQLEPKHAGIRLGRQYLALQEKAAGSASVSELESQVFNHLWAFFSRYYDNGDFLSTRRYSRREKYAIPYNGEEVYLHWANRDQYYIKTGEYFTDYQWKAGDVSVLFKLVQAETEKDNIKADKKRLFVPRLDEVSVSKRVITIPFEYRGLSEQETSSLAKTNQQDAIIAQALESLPKRKALRDTPGALYALLAEYRKTEKGESVSRLEHHVRRYTARNTRDYFIHKDLEGFLTRELDFYLKNEVLALDDLEVGDEERADGWFQLLQAIRAIGGKIITFLAQIENFQKRIFEKRKFVTETNYCFTLDRVPKTLWPKILNNKMQFEEWKKLYIIQDLKGYSEPLKQSFLEAWPSLMVDTKFFADDPDFVDTLLASQKDLEERLGSLLVHSENFQALNLLLPRFKEQVKCIYIDPPYNTGDSEILYKNDFIKASWLTLMENRLALALGFMPNEAVMFIAIDDFEMVDLCELMDTRFAQLRREMIVVNHHPQGGKAVALANTHEYMLTMIPIGHDLTLVGRSSENGVERRPFKRSGTAESNFRKWRPNSFYAVLIDPATSKVVSLEPPPARDTTYPISKTAKGLLRIYPVGSDGRERVWRKSYESCQELVANGKLVCSDKQTIYQLIESGERTAALFSNWIDKRYNSGTYGANLLRDIMGEENIFAYPKSVYIVEDAIYSADIRGQSIVMDFFAGSGTTAHAVLNLSQEDGGDRLTVLVEMGMYFDTVLKPRLQKVVFSTDWKDGKPIFPKVGKSSGISHAFKYIRLESYEDTLGNIAFEGPQRELKLPDYVLRYMLEFETRKSETLLNVEKLAAPFSYQLDILDGAERKTKPVDLPETFNYLLGLKVGSRKVHIRDGKHRYLVIRGKTNPHGEGGEREVVVIWRDVTGWKPGDFKADAEFVKKGKLTDGSDDVFVNADGVIPGARVLDPVFKERMFAPVTV